MTAGAHTGVQPPPPTKTKRKDLQATDSMLLDACSAVEVAQAGGQAVQAAERVEERPGHQKACKS